MEGVFSAIFIFVRFSELLLGMLVAADVVEVCEDILQSTPLLMTSQKSVNFNAKDV
jgi:hypothetical protein